MAGQVGDVELEAEEAQSEEKEQRPEAGEPPSSDHSHSNPHYAHYSPTQRRVVSLLIAVRVVASERLTSLQSP